jgi:thiol-disulfide isomerase/thioredoxin
MTAQRDDETWRGMVIAALICLAISLGVGAWRLTAQPAPVPSVPAFSLERLRGGRVSLAELSGKVVVIDFWATWCPPCRAEMPWLVNLGTRLESQGVVFIAISEDDPPGQVPLVNEFAREVPGLERFAVLGDPEIESAYGVTSLPTLFVLDRQGQLVKQFVGSAEEATVVELVERLAK